MTKIYRYVPLACTREYEYRCAQSKSRRIRGIWYMHMHAILLKTHICVRVVLMTHSYDTCNHETYMNTLIRKWVTERNVHVKMTSYDSVRIPNTWLYTHSYIHTLCTHTNTSALVLSQQEIQMKKNTKTHTKCKCAHTCVYNQA